MKRYCSGVTLVIVVLLATTSQHPWAIAAAPNSKPTPAASGKLDDQAARKATAEAEKLAVKKAAEAQAAREKELLQSSANALDALDTALWEQEKAEREVKQKTSAATQTADRASSEKASLDRSLQQKQQQLADAQKKFDTAKSASQKNLSDKKLSEFSGKAADQLMSLTAELESRKKANQEKLAAAQASLDTARNNQTQAEKDLASKQLAVRTARAKVAEADAAAFGGLKPLSPDKWDYAKARHLLTRAGFGGTPEEVERLHKMGLHAAVDYLVNFVDQPAFDLAFDGSRAERGHPADGLRDRKIREERGFRRTRWENNQMQRLREWWAQRLIQSNRGVEEKLTLFWHNTFCSEYDVVNNSYSMYRQNQLFREHAAGSYGAMLRAISHDPAMLRYLDNNRNVKGHPNENLAREIMELFSMGEGQGYTEKDIMEAARALTGYSYDGNDAEFRFNNSQHDPDRKTIFGRTGEFTGDDLVDLILAQPSTARYIAGKLFTFFAYEKPGAETVDSVAAMLRKRGYELRPTLKNLLVSEEFYSTRAMGTQIKSPAQLAVGMLRDLGVGNVDAQTVFNALSGMEQPLFDPPNVKGWVEGRAWVNSNRIFVRYNTIADLIERAAITGQQERGLDLVAVLAGRNFANTAEVVDHLITRCFVVPLESAKRAELIEFVGTLPPSSQWNDQRKQINARLRALLVLLLTTPEYQLG